MSQVLCRIFPIRFDMPDLETEGLRLYTPVSGEVITLVAMSIPEVPWDGTSPRMDFGQFVNGAPGGILGADDSFESTYDLTRQDNNGDGADPITVLTPVLETPGPWIMLNRYPLRALVNQTATVGGSPTGATQGRGNFYVTSVIP